MEDERPAHLSTVERLRLNRRLLLEPYQTIPTS